MKLVGLFSSVVAVLTLTFAASASAANVVPNPGFEQSGCGTNTPVLCGWVSTDPSARDTTNPHTGTASMNVECAYPDCDLYTGGAVSVSTDPAFCAPIGPGAHQASFWFRWAQGAVWLGAAFYATPDCTGPSSSAWFSGAPAGGDWQQAVGALAAPLGTQSALFSLEVTGGCVGACDYDGPCYCGIGATFDDVYVDDVGDTTPPAIGSFTPTSGPGGTTFVSITGTNFTGASSVTFNGTASLEFFVESSTNIVTFAPNGATSGPISVTTPFGTSTSGYSFTVTPQPPVVCCSEPTSGQVGTTVDIMGGNFTGATSVTFNGTPDPSFVVNSLNDITAHVPAGATSGPISVTTPGGTDTTGGPFTVTPSTPSPPSITSFTPTSGPIGTQVDIQGNGFTGAGSVTFGGIAASYTVNSPTDITAHVASGSTTGPISVTTSYGTATSGGSFTVTVPPPSISSFTPTSGPIGTLVDIQGNGFTRASSVTFGGTAASYTVNSPTDVTAQVPAGATSGQISVTTPGGTATTSSLFTVTLTPPSIAGFSPDSGRIGQPVTITGSDFTGATTVRLGATPAAFFVNSSTKITATVPTIARGSYNWFVTTPSGTSTSSGSFRVK
jgi:hypothetical protein